MAKDDDKKPAEGATPPLEPIVKKKMIEGDHAGAHGGAWKIALADMMTAMMAFFLLMWLLSATTQDQRKSIAEYFKPTSQSNVQMSTLSGPGGIGGGNSLMDPDGFPNTAKRTSFMERDTPQSEAGQAKNNGTSKDELNDKNPSELSEEERQ